jgi:signal transduction histidine kinase
MGAAAQLGGIWVGARRWWRPPPARTRTLIWLGLLGLALLLPWLRLLAAAPHLPLVLQAGAGGRILLAASSDAALRPAIGQALRSLQFADGSQLVAGPALLPQSARWTVDDPQRVQLQALRLQLGQALQPAPATVTAVFDDGLRVALTARPRGLAGLGWLGWALAALALGLLLAAALAVLAQPGPAAWLFLLLAGTQSLQLLLAAADTLPGLGWPTGLLRQGLPWRLCAEGISAAALVHLLALHPRRLQRAHAVGGLAWGGAGGAAAWLVLASPAGLWWWAQGLALASGAVAALLLQPLPGQPGSPLARQLQRLVLAGAATLLLLSLAMALSRGLAPQRVDILGAVAWSVFVAALLMLAPFLARVHPALREFALLAGVGSLAASLTVLLQATIGLDALAATVLALVMALGVHALARTWVLGQLAGPGTLSAERMFDSLYRAARALEQSPGQAARQLSGLLREVFDPLEVARSQRKAARVRVAPDGASLVVPVPHPSGLPAGAIVLRHAQQGRRLFTRADGQLCEQLLEQLRRAVAHDRAVEHGRAEERARIAQDLHDDIGARLLTLMYKAPNAEIEEYIRHTLQDLKTLTRGLAASNQRLSHAAVEWKTDINQRLNAAGCSLHWSFSTDRDLVLSAVQWSGLTRVLRELVNNIITHAKAGQVEISLQLERGQLTLTVSDDGIGSAPQDWAHGLGLGGVRKRVKLLGGQVVWLERAGRGIRCEVTARLADAGADQAPR